MVRYILFFCLLISSISELLSENINIKGKIKTKDGGGISFATISIFQSDSLVGGCISNEEGIFDYNIPQGKYKIEFNHLAYHKLVIPEKLYNDSVELYNIILESDDRILEEINVISSNVIYKADREIYLLNESYTSQAINSEDIIGKLPSVSINPVNRVIKVNGNSDVLLTLDGIPKRESYIRSLSPEKIKKIEVIRSVGGRYANDYSAVINFITNKEYVGVDILADEQATISAGDSNNGLFNNFNNVNISYFTANYNLYCNYNSDYQNYSLEKILNTNIGTSIQAEMSSLPEDNSKKSLQHTYSLGSDLYLNKDHTLSIEFGGDFKPENSNEAFTRSLTIVNGLNSYEMNENVDTKLNNNYVSAFYRGQLTSKISVESDITYRKSKENLVHNLLTGTSTRDELSDNEGQYVNFFISGRYKVSNNTFIDLDYNKIYRKDESIYTIDHQSSNAYHLYNNSNRFGIQMTSKLSTKTSLMLGLRFHQQIIDDNNSYDEMSQDNYLPFVALNWNVSEKVNARFLYKVNVDNPNSSMMLPNTTFIDSFAVETGNPYIKPSYYHKLQTTIDLGGGVLSIQPYYELGNDIISRVGAFNGDIIEYTYLNQMEYRKKGINLTSKIVLPISEGKYLMLNNDYENYSGYSKVNGLKYKTSDWLLRSQLIFYNYKRKFLAGLVLQKNNGRVIQSQGYEYNSNDLLGFLIRKTFFSDKLEAQAIYITPFDSFFNTHIGSYSANKEFVRDYQINIGLIQNSFQFRLAYTFNKNSDKKRNTTKREPEHEIKKSENLIN